MSISFFQFILILSIIIIFIAVLNCFIHRRKLGSVQPIDVVMASACIGSALLWVISYEMDMFSIQIDLPLMRYFNAFFSSTVYIAFENEWRVIRFMFLIYLGVILIDLALYIHEKQAKK